jgi:UDP-N-acetylmuramoyl-L-alanyl-D-glutamate--2,6-diaminopimelate ligase
MMSLRDLLDGVVPVDDSVTIRGLTEDSRQIAAGDAFVAIRGEHSDGHDFAAAAVARGAAAVLAERPIEGLDIPVIVVAQLRRRRGALAARLYGRPGDRLYCVGVTGTNGKTSIAHYLADLASRLGMPAGYVGTVGWGRIGALEPSRLTTSDPITTQARLGRLAGDGCAWAVLEASSHALDQGRLNEVPFRAAVFSNLTRDHLDYHADERAYAEAKARLFAWPGLELAVLNVDDPFGRELHGRLADGVRCVSYGRNAAAEVTWRNLELGSGAARGMWQTPWGEAPLCLPVQAEFSVANAAAALAVLCANGVELARAAAAASTLTPVPGRVERFEAAGSPAVVVDFAHTPDALEQVLAALRPAVRGRLICVFGCGGDRDPGKRPLMAAAAERHADELWLTSDNPRSEDPEAILADMAAGLSGRVPAHRRVDRAEAIECAVAAAGERDLVVVAGKGHEDYQEVAGTRRPYSDRSLVAQLLEARSSNRPPERGAN